MLVKGSKIKKFFYSHEYDYYEHLFDCDKIRKLEDDKEYDITKFKGFFDTRFNKQTSFEDVYIEYENDNFSENDRVVKSQSTDTLWVQLLNEMMRAITKPKLITPDL